MNRNLIIGNGTTFIPLWQNFIRELYTDEAFNDWGAWSIHNLRTQNELSKYNGVLYERKEKGRMLPYIRFSSEKDLTYFLVRWG